MNFNKTKQNTKKSQIFLKFFDILNLWTQGVMKKIGRRNVYSR